MPHGGGSGGGNFAVSEENARPIGASEAGDDVRVAGVVDVADFVRVLALFPFVERHCAGRTVAVG